MDTKVIKSEIEFKKWFGNNFKKLGYSEIKRDNKGKFPDFIMLKNDKEIRVELETLSSHFILHKHNLKKVDEVVCIHKDAHINIKILEVRGLRYKSRIKRLSATIEENTKQILDSLIKTGKYRNKSHIIERAIELLSEREK